MEKSRKSEKWVPVGDRTKKQQKKHYAKKRGFAIPPPQVHSNDKDYDRSKNSEIIDDEIVSWEDYEEGGDYGKS